MHGLNGYREVMDTLAWGLSQAGHEVSSDVNNTARDKTNILFGVQMLPEHVIHHLPPDTICYNLEQIANLRPDQIRPSLKLAAKKFTIWDYSPRNIATFEQLPLRHPPQLLPVGYAPVLDRIPKRPEQDIDVLFYGIPSPTRLGAIDQICRTGLRVVFVSGLYGEARDELIARAKVILNLSLYQHMHVFEIVRVSYLLANGKAVLSDIYPDSLIDPDLRDMVRFSTLDRIHEAATDLIRNDLKRQDLEQRALAFRQRDIRQYLEPVLATFLQQQQQQ